MKLIAFNKLRSTVRVLIGLTLSLAILPHPTFSQQAGHATDTRAAGSETPAPAFGREAASTPGPNAHSVTTSSAAVQPVLAQFSWLEGEWRGDWGSRSAELSWLEPKAGELTGIARITEGEKTLVLELFSLVENSEGVQLYLRHFTPELLPWEKSEATTLKLAAIDATKAVFVNSVDGEPRRIIFTRLDADTYSAHSELEPSQSDAQVIEITFHRQKQPAAPPSAGNAGRRKKS